LQIVTEQKYNVNIWRYLVGLAIIYQKSIDERKILAVKIVSDSQNNLLKTTFQEALVSIQMPHYTWWHWHCIILGILKCDLFYIPESLEMFVLNFCHSEREKYEWQAENKDSIYRTNGYLN
jgi:hypothetical protein